MRHFENTWEEAEGLAEIDTIPSGTRYSTLISLILELENTKSPEIMGEILFQLAALSKQLNINVDAALQNRIDEKKIDTYG